MHIPKYRKHSSRDLGFVEWKGKRHLMPGRFNSRVSKQAYQGFLSKHVFPGITPPPESSTVAWLCVQYLAFAREYYGADTGEYTHLNSVTKVMVEVAGTVLASEFTPKDLKSCREVMIGMGWVRTSINHQAQRIRRIFSWGVEEGIVPAATADALRHVAPLREGKCAAPESEPIEPVPPEWVDRTLPHLPPIIADMVRVQRLTGMRSSEVIGMTPAQIDKSPPELSTVDTSLWLYRPGKHKMRRKKQLMVPLGPKVQAILHPYLDRGPDVPLFSPRESVERHHAARTRKTKRQPSQVARKRKTRPKRVPGDHYTSKSYRRAIAEACRKNNLQHWHPHQLRHTLSTEVRAEYGLEAAQVILGHSHADVTQIYAERDLRLACKVAGSRG